METKVLAVDFTGGFEIYEPIRSALQGLEIGTLGEKYYIMVLSFHSAH